MDYKRFLSNKFNQPITMNKLVYEKIETPHIVLYKWNDGCVYRARYHCLPSGLYDLNHICNYIENKFSILNKRGESYLFIDELNAYDMIPNVEVRELEYRDESSLDALKNACTVEEVNLAQLTIHDIHVIGAFKDGVLIGCSSILDLYDAYDVGIIVHPNFRCMGVSTMLVAENSKWVLSLGRLCMYRCDDFNIGSYRTAIKLGYQKLIDVIIYDLKEES